MTSLHVIDENPNCLSVGMHKGEMDFGVNGSVAELSQEKMQEFRAMTMVAIGIAEDMWRRAQAGKSPVSKENTN